MCHHGDSRHPCSPFKSVTRLRHAMLLINKCHQCTKIKARLDWLSEQYLTSQCFNGLGVEFMTYAMLKGKSSYLKARWISGKLLLL